MRTNSRVTASSDWIVLSTECTYPPLRGWGDSTRLVFGVPAGVWSLPPMVSSGTLAGMGGVPPRSPPGRGGGLRRRVVYRRSLFRMTVLHTGGACAGDVEFL